MEYKISNLSNFNVDVSAGTIYGYASVFNTVDSYNDIVMTNAFENSLNKNKNIKMCWQHNKNKEIGYFENICEDQIGLFVEGKITDYKSYCLVKNNFINGLSIGYKVDNYEYDYKHRRVLKKVNLLEISIVNYPANKHSKIIFCK